MSNITVFNEIPKTMLKMILGNIFLYAPKFELIKRFSGFCPLIINTKMTYFIINNGYFYAV